MRNLGTTLVWALALLLITNTIVRAQDAAPAAAAPVAAQPAPTEPPAEQPKDPDRVLLTIGDDELTAWQAQVMIDHRAARDFVTAAEMWSNIKLKSAAARAQGIDSSRENAFILDLFRDHYMSFNILDKAIVADLPEPTEEEAKTFYDENQKRFERPFSATVQHITVRDREQAQGRQLAQEIVTKAMTGEDFDSLVNAFSKASDKNRKGQVRGGTQVLEKSLGKTAADAIASARDGDILGPFVGVQGFEVIKVNKLQAAGVTPFDDVKARIMSELTSKVQQEKRTSFMDDLKTNAQITKSEELLELEKAAAAQAPPPGPPGR